MRWRRHISECLTLRNQLLQTLIGGLFSAYFITKWALTEEASEHTHLYSRLPISDQSRVKTATLKDGRHHPDHYTAGGALIAVVDEDPNYPAVACGILVDLKQVDTQLPNEHSFELEESLNSGKKHVMTTFPLAFTKSMGNIWANDHLNYYYPFVAQAMSALYPKVTGKKKKAALPKIFSRGTMQVYNELSHSTRSSDGKHDTQRGTMTAFFAGHHLTAASHKRHNAILRTSLTNMLPHKAYFAKASSSGENIGCRLEPTTSIRVSNLPAYHQTARHVPSHPRACMS